MKKLTIYFDERQYNWLMGAYNKYLQNIDRVNRSTDRYISKHPDYRPSKINCHVEALDFDDWVVQTAFEKVQMDYLRERNDREVQQNETSHSKNEF